MTNKGKRWYGGTSGLAITVAAGMMLSATPAFAQVSGGRVTAGDATIAGQGSGQTTITQSSDRAILDWDSFSVAAGESAVFRQPSASSITVNRVTGSNPTNILGSVQANGRLVLVNRNGVVFGKGSSVDAAGLITTTHDIDAQAFMRGDSYLRFTNGGNDQAEIVVEGRITVHDAGMAAFVAPHVRNSGLIVAELGRVSLGSGKGFGIDLYGDGLVRFAPGDGITATFTGTDGKPVKALVENDGTIAARGGQVLLTASAARDVVNASVNVAGIVRADSVSTQGGVITLSGSGGVTTETDSVLSATGTGGGSVAIEGGSVGLGGVIDVTATGERQAGGSVTVTAEGQLSLGGATLADSMLGSGGSVAYRSASLMENTAGRTSASGLTDGGTIASVVDGMAMTSGRYAADGVYGSGGRIDMTAMDLRLLSATVSATGRHQGGLVRLGGAFQGGKTPDESQAYHASFLGRWGNLPALARAGRTFVNDGVRISVGSAKGQGGTAVVWSDDQTTFLGGIDARGVTGGSVEISSAGDLRRAALGEVKVGNGFLLLDPKNIIVGNPAIAMTWTYQGVIGKGYTGAANVDVALDQSDNFGTSVSLSADATRLAVAVPSEDGYNNVASNTGAVHLFTFTDQDFGGGALVGTIGKGYTGSHSFNVSWLTNYVGFGTSVSLNADATRLAIGQQSDAGSSNNTNGAGAVYLFTFADGSFTTPQLAARIGKGYTTTQNAKNIDLPLEQNDYFGGAVSLNADGTRLAVGAWGDDGSSNEDPNNGAVYLFSFSDANFSNGTLSAMIGGSYNGTNDISMSLEDSDAFGRAVSLNADGTRLAVGSPSDNGYNNDKPGIGAVYLFGFTNTNFTGGSLLKTIGAGYASATNGVSVADLDILDGFGSAVALNAAGTRLAIGAPYGDGNGNTQRDSGAVYIYGFGDASFGTTALQTTIGKGYTNSNDINLSVPEYARMGDSVSLNGAGDRLVAGSDGDPGFGNSQQGAGAVYMFKGTLPAVATTFGDLPADTVSLVASDISAQLSAGTAVTLQASNDLTIDRAINASGSNGNLPGALTLQAGRSILVNANVTNVGGAITLIANDTVAAGVVDAQRESGAAVITMATGTAINASAAAVNINIANGAGKTNTTSGDITLGSITGGMINIMNNGPTAGTGIVTQSGAVLRTFQTAGVTIKGDKFVNNAGSGLFSSGTPWKIWSGSPTNDTVGGLNFDFKHYGATFLVTSVTPGNGLMYTAPASVTASGGAVTKEYDGQTTATVGALTASGAFAGDTVLLTATDAEFANKNVGTGKTVNMTGVRITSATSNGKPVYGYTTASTASLTTGVITASPLYVIGITATSREYDATTNATITGARITPLGGDAVTLVSSGVTAAFTDKNAASGKTVNVSGYTITGADIGNYTLVQPSSVRADIWQATVQPTGLTATTRVYDGSTDVTITGGTVTALGSDVLTLDTSGAWANFDDRNAGTSKSISLGGYALGGADADNYTLSQPAGVTGTVTPFALTVSGVTATSRTYDGTTNATVYGGSVTGLINDDVSVDASAATGVFADKNVGTAKAVTATGFTLTGTAAGNYTVAQPTGVTADITKADLTVLGASATDKFYDATTSATLSGGYVTAFGSDVVTLSTSGATGVFSDKNIGMGKAVTGSGYVLTGTDAANYALHQPVGMTANILPTALYVTGVTASNREYNRTTNATVSGGTVTPLGSDQVSLRTSGVTASFSSKNAGTGINVTASGYALTGTDAANYVLIDPTGLTANIMPATLTISGVSVTNKTYDGNASAAVSNYGTISPISGDTVQLSTGSVSASFADKNAGTGKAVTVSGYYIFDTDSQNYNLVQPTGITATISPATLLISGVSATSRTYNGTTQVALSGGSVTGRNGDTVSLVTSGATGNFATKHVGTNKAVMASGYTLAGADAGNYTLTQPTGLTATVLAANLTVTGVTAANKVYDATVDATVSGGSINAFGSDDVALSSSGVTARFRFGDVATGEQVFASGYALTGTDAGNYTLIQPSGLTANITPASVTVTGLEVLTKSYDGTTSAQLSGGTVTGLGNDQLILSRNGATGTFADANAAYGKAVIVTGYALSGMYARNYTLVQPVGVTGNIRQAALSVSGITASSKVYDGTFDATLSGGTVTAFGSDIVILSSAGSTASFLDKNVGTNQVVFGSGYTISGADAGNYYLLQPYAFAAITAAPLTVTGATVSNKVYDGTTQATLSGGTITAFGSDVVTLTQGTAAFADKNAGTGKSVTVSGYALTGADAGNYTLTQPTSLTADITRAVLTVTGAAAQNKVYDGSVSATVTGGSISALGSDTVTLDAASATGTFADKAAGTGKAVTATGYTLSGADAANYDLAQPTGLTADIARAMLAVTGAIAQDKVYDGGVSATLTGGSVAALGSDTVTLDAASATGTFADKAAGTGKAVTATGYTLSGADAANYDLTEPTGLTANIGKATVTVTGVTAQNKVYDGTTQATLSGGTITAFGADVVTLTQGTGVFADKNAGTGKSVTVSGYALTGADAGNYTLTQPTSLTADITRAVLTVTGAAAQNKVYDASVSATVTGGSVAALGSDTVTLDAASATGTFVDKAAGTGKAVTATGYTLSGADAANYDLAQPTGLTADIARAMLAVTGAIAQDKVYDGGVSATLTGGSVAALGSDTVTLDAANATGTFADKATGTGKAVIATGYTLSGIDAANYDLTQPTGLTANIGKATVAVSGLTAQNKVYDGTTQATLSGGTITAFGADVVTLTQGTGVFADKNAGTGKSVTVSGYALTGADAGNYTLTQPTSLTADITRAVLTVTGAAAQNKVYDGSVSAALTGGSVSALGSDTVTLDAASATGTFADKTAGTGKAVTATGYTLSGADAANYDLTQPTGLTANIGKATVTVTGVTAQNKVYDGNTAAVVTGGTVDTVTGDTVSLSAGGVTASFADRHVGTDKVVVGTGYTLVGADAANYILVQPTALTATITRLSSVTWTGAGNGRDWFDPANWAGGALPDGANVAVVTLPAGADVRFDTPDGAGIVSLDQLTSGGSNATTLTMMSGGLNIASSLSVGTLLQTEGTIFGAGTVTASKGFEQSGGALAMSGAVTLYQTVGNLAYTSITAGGGLSINAAGSVRVGETNVTGTFSITAGGNVALDGPTVVDGPLAIAAGTSGAGTITQDRPLSVTGTAQLGAPNAISLNADRNTFAMPVSCNGTSGASGTCGAPASTGTTGSGSGTAGGSGSTSTGGSTGGSSTEGSGGGISTGGSTGGSSTGGSTGGSSTGGSTGGSSTGGSTGGSTTGGSTGGSSTGGSTGGSSTGGSTGGSSTGGSTGGSSTGGSNGGSSTGGSTGGSSTGGSNGGSSTGGSTGGSTTGGSTGGSSTGGSTGGSSTGGSTGGSSTGGSTGGSSTGGSNGGSSTGGSTGGSSTGGSTGGSSTGGSTGGSSTGGSTGGAPGGGTNTLANRTAEVRRVTNTLSSLTNVGVGVTSTGTTGFSAGGSAMLPTSTTVTFQPIAGSSSATNGAASSPQSTGETVAERGPSFTTADLDKPKSKYRTTRPQVNLGDKVYYVGN